MIAEKPVTLILWKKFTAEELQEKGGELSDAVLELSGVEASKKAAMDVFKQNIEGIEGTVVRLSREIRAKGVDAQTGCIIRFHVPRTAFKQIVRLDTGELVREEQMTPSECQEHLFEAQEIDQLNRIYNEAEPPNEANRDTAS